MKSPETLPTDQFKPALLIFMERFPIVGPGRRERDGSVVFSCLIRERNQGNRRHFMWEKTESAPTQFCPFFFVYVNSMEHGSLLFFET